MDPRDCRGPKSDFADARSAAEDAPIRLTIGASDGPPVLLLHGWPYDSHSYVDVAPRLAARGCRVIVPHLRGHKTIRFLESATPRSRQQTSIGADVIALMGALTVPRALVARYDWGGRAVVPVP